MQAILLMINDFNYIMQWLTILAIEQNVPKIVMKCLGQCKFVFVASYRK